MAHLKRISHYRIYDDNDDSDVITLCNKCFEEIENIENIEFGNMLLKIPNGVNIAEKK